MRRRRDQAAAAGVHPHSESTGAARRQHQHFITARSRFQAPCGLGRQYVLFGIVLRILDQFVFQPRIVFDLQVNHVEIARSWIAEPNDVVDRHVEDPRLRCENLGLELRSHNHRGEFLLIVLSLGGAHQRDALDGAGASALERRLYGMRLADPQGGERELQHAAARLDRRIRADEVEAIGDRQFDLDPLTIDAPFVARRRDELNVLFNAGRRRANVIQLDVRRQPFDGRLPGDDRHAGAGRRGWIGGPNDFDADAVDARGGRKLGDAHFGQATQIADDHLFLRSAWQ